jgi:heat shock protein HslJ
MEPAATTWTVSRIETESGDLAPVVEGTALNINVGAERVWGSSGCNTYSGPAVLDVPVRIGPLVSTMMFCFQPDGVMDQERRFLDLLEAADTVRVDDDRLEIGHAGRPTILALPIVVTLDGSWSLLLYDNGAALVGTTPGVEVTVEFEDGRIHGHSGCNRYTARFVTEGAGLRVSAVGGTKMACPDPGTMEQERRFLELLSSVVTYEIRDGSLLDLLAGDGTRLLQLARR